MIWTPSLGRYVPSRDRNRKPPTFLSQEDSFKETRSLLYAKRRQGICTRGAITPEESHQGRKLDSNFGLDGYVRHFLCYISICAVLCVLMFYVFFRVPRSTRPPALAALARPIGIEPGPKSTAPTSLSQKDSYPAERSASARILHPWSRRPRKLTKGGKLGGHFVRAREGKAHPVF